MSIQIPEGAVRDIVAKAIMESIDDEARDKILSDAVAGLITTPPKQHGYGAIDRESPLREAFDMAVRAAVNAEARRLVDDSEEVQRYIKARVGESIAALCADNYEGLPEKIGEAVGAWLRDQRR